MAMLKQTAAFAFTALSALTGVGDAQASSRTPRVPGTVLQGAAIPACHTRGGARVRFRAVAHLDTLAMAYTASPRDRRATRELRRDGLPDAAGAYVVYNPALLSRMAPQTQRQVLAHECAHHRLGHTENANPSPRVERRNEEQADCAAVGIMRRDYQMSRAEIKRGLQVFLSPMFAGLSAAETASHGSGRQRYNLGMRCLGM